MEGSPDERGAPREGRGHVAKFFSGLAFWSLLLICLVMMGFLVAIMMGFIPIQEAT